MYMPSIMVDDLEASLSRSMRLRKLLAVAVRSLQWSYAIFWSFSQIQHGVLEWGEGYYNGDMKKRKNKSHEMDPSKYGLQRSEQLRKLYLSMLEGDNTSTTTNGHGQTEDEDENKCSNRMLTADDLSDEEWYYLLCMSYVFSPSQCLPGQALATGETVWLCNAQQSETKLFTRSLLARSASIQTVVCFPYLGGVIELGITDLIAEDDNLIQHIKDCLSETSILDCSKMKISQEFRGGSNEICCDFDEDLQYKKTLFSVLKPAANRFKREDCDTKDPASSYSGSSFSPWKLSSVPPDMNQHNHNQKQNNVLWKILHDVPLMHSADAKRMFQTETKTGLNQGVAIENNPSDKTKENEKFTLLKSIVPRVNELDKESILNNTIKYLQELEARVDELECRMEQREKSTKENNISELIEETSETDQVMVRDETNVKVQLKESEVMIEVRCLYRDYIVADIMEAMSHLNMDAFSIRSRSRDGFLELDLKAKFRGAAVTSAGMIKRELKRVACEI